MALPNLQILKTLITTSEWANTKEIIDDVCSRVHTVLWKETPTFSRLLESIKTIVPLFYTPQNFMSSEESLVMKWVFLVALKEIVDALWFEYDRQNPDFPMEMMNLFEKNGYFLGVNGIQMKEWEFSLNCPIFKVHTKDTFDTSSMQLPGLEEQGIQMPYTELWEEYIWDFRTTQEYENQYGAKFDYNAFVFIHPITWEKRVYLNKKSIEKTAKDTKVPYQKAKLCALYNEAWSYVSSPAFWGGKNLGKKFSQLWISHKYLQDFDVFQLIEALWDFASMKYSGNFRNEAIRVLNSSTYSYLLSQRICSDAINEIASSKVNFWFQDKTYVDKTIRKMRNKDLVTFKDVFLKKVEDALAVLVREVQKQLSSDNDL